MESFETFGVMPELSVSLASVFFIHVIIFEEGEI